MNNNHDAWYAFAAKYFAQASNFECFLNNLKKLPDKGFNTANRLGMFLAQCAHESCNFKVTVENLNYSAQALLRVFPKYFSIATVNSYARNPEKIANRVYGNRMGNNQVGEGWKYRGRGYIQLTGKDNYSRLSAYFKANNINDIKDPLEDPDVLRSPDGAMFSAVWFWNLHNLNVYADKNDIKSCTKVINGGYNGLDARTKLYDQIKQGIKEFKLL